MTEKIAFKNNPLTRQNQIIWEYPDELVISIALMKGVLDRATEMIAQRFCDEHYADIVRFVNTGEIAKEVASVVLARLTAKLS